MDSPKRNKERLDKILNAWQTLAPDKSFGGMTPAQFKAKIKPSYDSRDRLVVLENQTRAEQATRDDADKESLAAAQAVVNGVKGDPTEGPDSDLYESFGYVRESEKKSGLTRRKKSPKTPTT
jgi:hypothetical protein